MHGPQWACGNLTTQTAQIALVSPGESEPRGVFSWRDCWDWACSRRAFSRHRAGLPQHAWCLCSPKALQVDIRSKQIWNDFPCLWTQHVQLCPWSFTPIFSINPMAHSTSLFLERLLPYRGQTPIHVHSFFTASSCSSHLPLLPFQFFSS